MTYSNFKSYKCKRYKHIDKQLSINKVKNYIQNPQKIAQHSFLPFIHYDITFYKYSNSFSENTYLRPIKEKTRSILYTGHLDSFIYKYYAEKLNAYYNKYSISHSINHFSVAYRNNKQHQSSINFAASAISYIKSHDEMLIIIGDFKNFFDSLDHRLLKERLQHVLDVQYLESDWYNIFKSLTKYGYVEKELLDTSDSKFVCKSNEISYFKTLKDFRSFQKIHKCKYNNKKFGIPQGNSMSGILANIYSIDFDQSMGELAKENNGLYRRYSDDFILTLSENMLTKQYGKAYLNIIMSKILTLAQDNKIILQKEKTDIKFYKNHKIIDLNDNKLSHVNYLGFIFDGESVKIREKSIYKFYRNARKEIREAHRVKIYRRMKKLPKRNRIYSLYTDFGNSKLYRSNFIDYAKRAQKIFDNISPNTNNQMMNQLKNRKKIIEKELGYRIHSRI